MTFLVDPPIKRFAQRHTYLNFDGIAYRDLGVSMFRQQQASGGGGSSNALVRTETITSLNSHSNPSSGSGSMIQPTATKRVPSPDRTRRDEPKGGDYGGLPHKRSRPLTPPPRDRDRDRWEGPPKGRRYGSPSWDRDRERERSPPPRRIEKERDEPEKPVVPQVLSWFLGSLPAAQSFDGMYQLACRL